MLNASAISPSLTVSDIQKSLRFYTDGLGFEIGNKQEFEGKLQYVGLSAGAGAGSLGLNQDDFKKGKDRVKGTGVRIWISTSQDIVAIAERAKKAGIALDGEPSKLPWGPMAVAITDPDGYKLTIANSE